MSESKKTKGFKGSKPGHYLSIGTSVFSAFGVAKQVKKAREEGDTLQLLDAVLSAAALATSVALLVRELRRMNDDGIDVLAD